MKNKNQVMVAVAMVIAITAALAGKLYAENATNNNVYGYTRTGQCAVGDPSNIIEYGCVVSSTGSVCHIFIEVNGVWEIDQAFKSPVSTAFCALTLRTPY